MSSVAKGTATIFAAAIEIESATQRAAYLDEACGNDQRLRQDLEKLVTDHFRAGDFLEKPARNVAPTIDQPIAEQPGTHVGPYKLLQKIGEGGMGVVYMAEQTEPVSRRVAIKVIKPGMDTNQVIARFEAERQALAIMDHPGIAKVFDAGATDSGRPYFAMELVKGIPITQYCDEQHFTPRQRLELFVQICQAVQHAHQKGIIHRDIKATNILVAEYDQQAVPKIIDFGVAKATSQKLTEKTMFTQLGQVVGTLEYMSPEQAKLNQLDIDTRSDIYSLGVLLYELLVGSTPFDRQRLRSAAFEEMLRIIREEEPPRPSLRLSTIDTLRDVAAHRKTEPRKLSTLVRGELDWIVMRALEKDRARRYETANGFAADIRRYLSGDAVVACPPSAAYRFRKFARRNRAFLATAAMIGLALLLGQISTFWQWQLTERARAKEETAKEVANSALASESVAKKEAVEALNREAEQKQEVQRQLDISQVLRLLSESRSVNTEAPVRSVLLALEGVKTSRRTANVMLPVAHETLLSASHLIGGRPLVGHKGSAMSLLISPDSRLAVTGDGPGDVFVWNLRHPASAPIVLRGHARSVNCLAIGPQGRWLVTGSFDGKVRVWDLMAADPKTAAFVLNNHTGSIAAVAISPDGRRVATAGRDKMAYLWELTPEGPRSPRALEGHQSRLWSIEFDPTGRWLATGSDDPTALLWDMTLDDPHESPQVLRGHTGNVFARFGPRGKWLATGGSDKTVRLWDLSQEVPVTRFVLAGHEGAILWRCGEVFSRDGKWLVTGSEDHTARVWNLAAEDPTVNPLVFRRHNGAVWDCRFSPDGRWLVTGSKDKQVRLFDLTSPDPPRAPVVLASHDLAITQLAISPDGEWLITASYDQVPRVWPLGKRVPSPSPLVLQGHASQVNDLAVTPDGRRLVTGSWDTTTRVWDLKSADPSSSAIVLPRTGHEGSTMRLSSQGAVAVSPDGRWLATGSSATQVKLWELDALDAASEPVELQGHQGAVTALAFSGNSRWLVTGSEDTTARVWDLAAAGQAARELPGHDVVWQVAVDRHGRWVITLSGDAVGPFGMAFDSFARLWDLRSPAAAPRPILLAGHERAVESVGISPDGRWAVTTSGDNSLGGDNTASTDKVDKNALLWDLTAENPAATPHVLEGHEHRVPRALFTPDSQRLVTSSLDGTLRVWDLTADDPAATARVLHTIRGGKGLACSADSRWLVMSGNDGTARVWDLDAHDPNDAPVVLRGHPSVKTVAISPKGRWAITGGNDGEARLWDLDLDSLISRTTRLAGRELSAVERQRHLLEVAGERER